MDNGVTLKSIFREIISDGSYLATIINTEDQLSESVGKKVTSDVVVKKIKNDQIILKIGIRHTFNTFPKKIRHILHTDYYRLGVQVSDKYKNISFLNSLNVLLRPDLQFKNAQDQIEQYRLFNKFLHHKFEMFATIYKQVEGIKKTNKKTKISKELICNLDKGIISIDTLKFIADIFEINILICDFSNNKMYFVWTHGKIFPYLNLTKRLFCFSCIYDPSFDMAGISNEDFPCVGYVFEPLVIETPNYERTVYKNILLDSDNIIQNDPIKLNVIGLHVLFTWDINPSDYANIVEKYDQN